MAEVIVALDVASRAEALELADELEAATFFKVGLELYTSAGCGIVEELKGRGKRVFLDLKLHDIPNTVARTVRAASAMGVDMLTVHTLGGASMLEAAAKAAARASGRREAPVQLVGVTLLTSLASADLEATWGRPVHSLAEEALRLGRLAASTGLDGAVASVYEAAALKRALGPTFLVVTPGIRREGGERHDQSRAATASAALEAGADYLVVGRAVTTDAEPRAALESILAEIGSTALRLPEESLR